MRWWYGLACMLVAGTCSLVAQTSSSLSSSAKTVETITLPMPAEATWVLPAVGATRVAVVTRDHTLRVWDLATRRLLQTIPLDDVLIEFAAISPDGRWIFTGDHAGKGVLWDSETAQAIIQMQLAHYALAAAFSRDGKSLAIAPAGDPVEVFDVATTRKLFQTQEVSGGATAIAFSPDGASIATSDGDTEVRVYDARTGKLMAENKDFLQEALGVTFTSNSQQVMAAGADKTLAYIDAASGKAVRHIENIVEPVFYAETSPNGALIATILLKADNMNSPAPVIAWDVASGLKKLEWVPPSPPLNIGWTAEGQLLCFTGTTDALHVWRIQ